MSSAMTFEYFGAPQKSPEWFKLRLGKVTASRLADWLAVSKAKGKQGTPLKPRLDYEKELMFERQFGVSFETYVTGAMQEGIDYEGFAAREYERTLYPAQVVEECGCWYNDVFVASPDRTVGTEGLLEIKIVRDSTFTDILMNGVPDKYQKQIQGQLFASGRKWCDFIALNLNTRNFVILRVEPDHEFFEYLELALQEQLVTEPFATTNLHPVKGELPAGEIEFSERDNNYILKGDW